MALIGLLAAAQGGQYFANAAQTADILPQQAEAALARLAPAIAEALHDRAAKDPENFENLLDLLEDGDGSSDLDDPRSVMGAEAIEDGNAILKDLYGSTAKAQAVMAELIPNLDETRLKTLSAIAATSVLASLAQSYHQAQAIAAPQKATSSEGGGLFGNILSAVVEGLVKGAAQQLAPKRRRRRSYASYWGAPRQSRPRRRRRHAPSLNDIFGQILGTRR